MVKLNFTLVPEASAALHDALVCLNKFSESVSIEARRDRLSLTALNSSKSAYASFALDASKFFSRYEFAPNVNSTEGRFTCRIYNKALLSVFKGRVVDPRGKDTAIDRCEVSLQDRPNDTECRLIIRMLSNKGVTKTYKLTYESVEVMHALFDKASAHNRWTIQSPMLKEIIEYFGPKTEQLDIHAEDGRVTYTSFTEKISNSKEIFKHPLRTSVAISTTDFDLFSAAEKMHIIVNVRDFKAIVAHADTLKTALRAYYSKPTRPLQFSYGTSGASHTLPSGANSRAQSITMLSHTEARIAPSEMPPPSAPASRTSTRIRRAPGSAARPASQLQQPVEADPESLFMQQDDDDRHWEPANYEEEETLGWDASADNAEFHPMFRDSVSGTSGIRTEAQEAADGLAPTQRLSEIQAHQLW